MNQPTPMMAHGDEGMHGSKLPLSVWFWAAYLMATHSNGISAYQLWRQLGLDSHKTAWPLAAKLRRAIADPERNGLSGFVEIDETTINHGLLRPYKELLR